MKAQRNATRGTIRALSVLLPAALLLWVASLSYTGPTAHDSAAIRLDQIGWHAPQSEKRCDWIANLQKARDEGSKTFLLERWMLALRWRRVAVT